MSVYMTLSRSVNYKDKSNTVAGEEDVQNRTERLALALAIHLEI